MKSYALICAYNEEKTANEVIKNTLKYVDKVIFVNDGSKDRTFELAKKEFGNYKKVIIISYLRNRGKGYAMITGFRRFSKENGDILVTLDADKQHNPKEIPAVMSAIKEGNADIAIGIKHPRSKHSQPKLRNFLAGVSSNMLYRSSGRYFDDVSSGFRCYSKKAVRSILPLLKSEDYGIELEILQNAMKKNLRISEISISCSYKYGKKRNLSKVASGYLKFSIKHRNEIFKNIGKTILRSNK
jgi:glycosyltransferase involved in cell wall biosynthesis